MLRTSFTAALALAAALTSLSVAAHADPLVIATGKAGGGYDGFAQTMKTRLEQRNVEAVVENLPGSDATSLAVCNGKAGAAIAQVDAIFARANDGCAPEAVGLYGSEFAMILFPPGSRNDELSDLDEGSNVLVDAVGSGSELFARTIIGIETGDNGDGDDWASMTLVAQPVKKAQTQFKLGKVDAVILVRKFKNDDVANLLSLGWKYGELWDRDINDLNFNGKPLYEAKKNTDGAWGYVVESFVLAAENLESENPAAYAALQEVLD